VQERKKEMDDLASATANLIYGGAHQQQARPMHEQNMHPLVRDQLDRQRAKVVQNLLENPALCARLDQIEAKLDALLAKDRQP
jgi:hypothetical protein